MKRILFATILAVLLASVAGTSLAGEERAVMVSAAVSLTSSLTELGGAFEKENPGVRVVFNFGASGTLLQQLVAGGQADILITADQESMAKAEEKGLTDPASKRNFVANRLVLAAPAGVSAKISSVKELAGDGVKKVAIGDPAFVPAGRYARRYLEGAALWGAVEPKLVIGGNVRQVLDYIARGEVDAGFVYSTDAAAKKDTVLVADALEGSEKAFYPMALLKDGAARELAVRFMEYATGPKGRAVTKKYGFIEP